MPNANQQESPSSKRPKPVWTEEMRQAARERMAERNKSGTMKPMSEEARQKARERMAAITEARRAAFPPPNAPKPEPVPEPAPTPKPEPKPAPAVFFFDVRLSARTMGRLQCLLDAKDFTFIDHDDLIAWLIRQTAEHNRLAQWHLNMRYQHEREEAL